MTATTIAMPVPVVGHPRSKVAWAIADALAVAKRNIIAMTRTPQVLVFSTVQRAQSWCMDSSLSLLVLAFLALVCLCPVSDKAWPTPVVHHPNQVQMIFQRQS